MKKVLLLVIVLSSSVALLAQGNFDFYISNAGNDANSGTREFPKKTIAGFGNGIAAGAVAGSNCLNIGFRSGDVFPESFNPGFPVHAGTYFTGNDKKFAILKGSGDFNTGWQQYNNQNVYRQTIPLQGFIGYGINNIGYYSYVYVFEIDRQLELTAPITARRTLKFVTTLAEAIATPGSFYEPLASNVDTISVYIHSSDGSNPNNNSRYRYEVSTIDRAINSTYQQNNHFERLWVTGYGAGNGMIPSGANSSFDRMIFGPGAAIHHLGLRGAVINNSLFLPGPKNTNGYAVVFYDVQGYHRHNTIRNSIFMDIKYPIYSHKSNGSNFGALELDNVIAFGDTTEAGSFIESLDTDSAFVNNVYSDHYSYGYNSPWARYASIKNSIFKDVRMGISFPYYSIAATVNNNYIRVSNIRNGQLGYGILLSKSNRVIISNNIIHFKNPDPVVSASPGFVGYMIDGTGYGDRYAEVTGNIFICDIASDNYMVMARANTESGTRTSRDKWRNNVYILVNGNRVEWRVNNPASNNGAYEVTSFQQWQQQSGQDKNSLYFDLRNDPRGLKAIFVDPDNGDYSFANTIEANAIKAIRAGMLNPVTCFLKRPSYEDAAKIIMTDGVLTAGACRNPCNQGNVRTENRLTTDLAGNNTVTLNWQIGDESAVDHFEIMRSFGSNDFTTIASLPAKNDLNYTFSDKNVMAGITYRYSVAVITRLNERCYSAVNVIKTNDSRPVNIYPNPSAGKITIGLNAYTGPVKISIHNALGIKVYEKEVNAYYGIPVMADLSNKSKGYYYITVLAGDQISKQGFVLQ